MFDVRFGSGDAGLGRGLGSTLFQKGGPNNVSFLNHHPLVSVIIPCYNGERYLAETIRSVLAQSYRPLEVIVVDDASTDQSAEIAAAFGPPVRVLRNARNMERSWSRNRGIQESTANYIAFIDADDLWHPRKLEIQMLQFTAHPACGLTCCDFIGFRTPAEITAAPPPSNATARVESRLDRTLVRDNKIHCLTVLMRKTAWANAGGFDASLRLAEDYDLWLRATRLYDVLVLDDILAYYRLHDAQTVANPGPVAHAAFRVRSRHIRQHPDVLAGKTAEERWLDQYGHLRTQSIDLFRHGNWLAGITTWLRLIWHSPFARETYREHWRSCCLHFFQSNPNITEKSP